ncbi:heme peroxidase [Mycena epipterygia]|nr:heme peroxidase [Mycena epipterygia]
MRSSASLFSLLFTYLLSVPVHGSPKDVVRQVADDSESGIPTVANVQNPLCKPWYAIRDSIMGGIYHGRCGDPARASVRLAFHDAATFSLALEAAGQPNGAADGSMLTDPNEVLRPDNNGLQTIVGLLKPLPAKFGVSPGDVLHASTFFLDALMFIDFLSQLAGVLGVLACPGGPVINTYIGRTKPKNIAPDGLLPNPNSPVKVLTDRFADMGFSIRELMALIGAHTAGKQRFVNTAVAPSSFDSTVNIWDVRFYSETQSSTVAPGTFKLNSDVNFSHNATTQKDYNRFVGNQDNWASEYAAAHEKMSLLGLDTSTLTDCTEILPQSIDLKNLAVDSESEETDPVIDPVKLEAAIQQFRSIWL